VIGDAEDSARDAIIIAAAQKVEHYEIAGYGTARTWAELLAKRDIAALLEDTLKEEKEADQTLTGIAESFVNRAAARTDASRWGRSAGETRAQAADRSSGSRRPRPRVGKRAR